MTERPCCIACRDDGGWGPDSMPPIQYHTCSMKGPKTKKAILKAIEAAAWNIYFSFSSIMPGGDYISQGELDHLLYRLALLHKTERTAYNK